MAALTAAQFEDIRQHIGELDEVVSKITNVVIQRDYDKALAFGDDAEYTEARTVVYLLRRLLGIERHQVDVRGEIQQESRSQKFKHIQEILLPMWEELAGMTSEGHIDMGGLDLGLDYTEADYEAEYGVSDE